ncbi:MAG: acyl-CoA hydrolase [Pseudomonadales bacterium]|jgi:acyl-CoA hydrolase
MGNLVCVSVKIIYTGTSSVHVLLDVSATDPREDSYQSTARCILVFVAMGDDKKSMAV